ADVDREKAAALAEAIGGSVADTNAAVAEQADVVVLCHKPAQLEDVAGEIREAAGTIVSILGGVPVAAVEDAYPDRPVYRFMPNQGVEVRRGVLCYVAGSRAADGPERELLELFERLGTVVAVPEEQMEAATAVMSCAPAWIALAAEALVDAGVRHGIPRDQAEHMVAETVAGTGELLTRAGVDPVELRRRVTSPGGLTERGTAALEVAGLRAGFDSAVDAVVAP
ncbi:MAG: pyrroline-5-carboxylate reductase, partial [Thermoleophilaceae bacterium]|nr:pyrroline-5-carboxylate reductase [Thermoleophilaceae bacterium]